MVDSEIRTEIEYAEFLAEQLDTYFLMFYDYYAETVEKPEKVLYDKDVFIRAMTDIQDKVEGLHVRLKHMVEMAYGEGK